MGSIKGQQRIAAKLRELMKGLALEIRLEPKKRGGFVLDIASWFIWDVMKAKVVESDSPIPHNVSLACVLTSYTGKNYVAKATSCTPLVVTRHACMRLAQRAGVRTVEDLLMTMGVLWGSTTALMIMLGDEVWNPPRKCWFIPIKTIGGETMAVAVLEKCRSGKDRLIITTILQPGMDGADEGIIATYNAVKAARSGKSPSRESAARKCPQPSRNRSTHQTWIG